MKCRYTQKILGIVLWGALCLSAMNATARLPKPVQASGMALAVDVETQTLVLKQGGNRKPLVLDWRKDTKFTMDGQPATASELRNGTTVVVRYQYISFHNPRLVEVSWTAKEPGKK